MTRLRERLKAETARSHERLEQRLDLLRPTLSRDELGALLSRFWGFYIVCEEQLKLAPAELAAFFAERRKVPRLENDLRALGVSPEAMASLDVCRLQPATTVAQVLGRWYVLEGATLGGQIVARHLRERLGLQAEECRFFLSYGEEVAVKWRAFCELLERYESPATDDATVEAAQATFAALENWLLEPSSP